MWDGTTVWALNLHLIEDPFCEALHRHIKDRVQSWQSRKAT